MGGEGDGGWVTRLLGARGLTAAEAGAVERERVARNLLRARAATPVLAGLLIVVAALMLLVPTGGDTEARWKLGVALIDLGGAAVLALATLLARSTGPGLAGARRHLGEGLIVVGVAIGAALVANSMVYQFKMIAWVATAMLVAVVFHPRPLVHLLVQLAGFAAVVATVFAATPDTASRLGHVTTALAALVSVLVVERLTFAAFVRETVMRHKLGEMNRELEHRVTQQVREIVENNVRIEALNRQLAGKVASRSEDLAAALRRLAEAEHGGDTLAPGTLLGDRFELKYVIGVGGMGVVYAAIDRLADQRVAVKVVRTQSGDLTTGVRFLQEASAAAQLAHPAIVRVLHVDVTDDGRLYQVLELVEGQNLDGCRERGRAVPPAVVARLGAVLADALAVAHAMGVVHRDVKPHNIMITADAPGCRLLDFGLAKLRESLSRMSLSTEGAVIGTPQFLAPEQIATPLEVTGAADVYALGTVLYQALTGRLPFKASDPMQWLYAHVHDAPAPLGEREAPAPLRVLLERCLAKSPAARPDARSLAADLARLADDLDAPTLEAWAATVDYVDTRPLVLPAIAAPGVAGGVGGGGRVAGAGGGGGVRGGGGGAGGGGGGVEVGAGVGVGVGAAGGGAGLDRAGMGMAGDGLGGLPPGADGAVTLDSPAAVGALAAAVRAAGPGGAGGPGGAAVLGGATGPVATAAGAAAGATGAGAGAAGAGAGVGEPGPDAALPTADPSTVTAPQIVSAVRAARTPAGDRRGRP